MLGKSMVLLLLVSFANLADADVREGREATRGELLYSTHCIACHSAQVHWREKKLATDWATLRSITNSASTFLPTIASRCEWPHTTTSTPIATGSMASSARSWIAKTQTPPISRRCVCGRRLAHGPWSLLPRTAATGAI